MISKYQQSLLRTVVWDCDVTMGDCENNVHAKTVQRDLND